ncbi:Phosphatidylinositol 4-phosphate 5-kinase its3 [Zancudomyces culisetae]|nr:Phosphatidylinositol 4-phosphate 5-kinase its3 [Zancudomyces culisetae]|eukprot:OMH80111.1 Phosphatidylinositol 4-phosphate 5-kinase its3 [Zancudomyces culisetae]
MNNLFPPTRVIHREFDLKGSTLGREYKPKSGDEDKQLMCMKDLDWIRSGMKLEMGPACREKFTKQLAADVELLVQLNIMDYSLLVGVHYLNSEEQSEFVTERRLRMFDPEVTNLPSQMSSADRAVTLRNKVVLTDPIAFPIDSDHHTHPRNPPHPRPTLVTSVLDSYAKHKPGGARNGREAFVDASTGLYDDGSNIVPIPTRNNGKPSKLIRQKSERQRFSIDSENIVPLASGGRMNRIDVNAYLSDGGILATNGDNEPTDKLYYLGVIDILTPYSQKKKVEHFFKSIWHVGESDMISAVNPRKYGWRYLSFIFNQFSGISDAQDDETINRILENFESVNFEIKPRRHFPFH